MIREECKWQVGNGCTIKIWEHDWLPLDHQPRIFSTKLAGCAVTKVKDLMCLDREGWKQLLIRDLFNEVEQAAILSLPISSMGVGDRLV